MIPEPAAGVKPASPDAWDAVVVGGGPAGLMAAEALAASGARVLVAEAKPSLGRKFLMAGKSGLNLTRDEAPERFLAAYGAAAPWLAPVVAGFGPEAVRAWAEDLGQPTFAGSSGRVFPRSMKASPLLRAWLARLGGLGVDFRTRWRWTGWRGERLCIVTPEGPTELAPRVTVLALGGASWARLGSDGAWVSILAGAGVPLAPFAPANMGFEADWSPAMARHAGTPVKALRLSAGGRSVRGEVVVTAAGLEGGGLYALAAPLRDAMTQAGTILRLDLLPDLAEAEVAGRLARAPARLSLANRLRRALRLPPVKAALLREALPRPPTDPAELARALKNLDLRLARPRPIDEAISTAGGVMAAGIDAGLMLRSRPGVFVAGEMLDWEAPTGGYLLTACLATGRHAGRAAARHLAGVDRQRGAT